MYTHVIRKACAVSVVCPGVRDSTSAERRRAPASVSQLGGVRNRKNDFQPPKKLAKSVKVAAIYYTLWKNINRYAHFVTKHQPIWLSKLNYKCKKKNGGPHKINFSTSNWITVPSKKGLSQIEIQKLSKMQVLYFYLERLFLATQRTQISRFSRF